MLEIKNLVGTRLSALEAAYNAHDMLRQINKYDRFSEK